MPNIDVLTAANALCRDPNGAVREGTAPTAKYSYNLIETGITDEVRDYAMTRVPTVVVNCNIINRCLQGRAITESSARRSWLDMEPE